MVSNASMSVRAIAALTGIGCALVVCPAAQAWIEVGDAPNGLGGNWQVIDLTQGGTLTDIRGELLGPGDPGPQDDDFVDAYLIEVNDPVQFQVRTDNDPGTPASFDTMLWLFQADVDTGMSTGMLANNDVNALELRSRLVASSDDGTNITIGPGTYLLAITGFEFIPVNGAGEQIFDIPLGDSDQISGPDGSANGDDLADWANLTFPPGTDPAFANYFITLEGVGPIPSPGSAMLAAVAMAVGGSRRRRR